MKRLKWIIASALACLLLLQTMVAIGTSGEVYAETTPEDMPPAYHIMGNVKTDIICSQEAEKLIRADFTISGGTYDAVSDQNGAFDLQFSSYVIIKKPGFLKRTIGDISFSNFTAHLNDIPMWAGDMNEDDCINMADILLLAARFNSTKGDSLYMADSDINKDDAVNIVDILCIAKHFNATPLSYPSYAQISPTPTVSPTPTPTTVPSGLEIERKFLVDTSKIPYNLSTLDKYELTQAYISFSPEIRIRNADDWMYFLTVKAYVGSDLMTREEREFVINEQEYNTLMKKKEGNTIYKTRYQGLDKDGAMFAIDIYKGDLAGLAYYEVEFPNEEIANKYIPPDWVGKDVTNDKRYKNGSLAQYGIPK